jgi:hypothetical protein
MNQQGQFFEKKSCLDSSNSLKKRCLDSSKLAGFLLKMSLFLAYRTAQHIRTIKFMTKKERKKEIKEERNK